YEVDAYIDAQKDFPPTNIPLNTGDGILYHQKTDIFGRMMSYSTDKEGKGVFIPIPVKRVKEIIMLNRKGVIPPKAVEISDNVPEDIKYTDGVGEESLSRFDDKNNRRKRKNRNNRNRNNGNPGNNGNSNARRNENKEQDRSNNNNNNNNNNRQQRPQQNGPRTEQRREQRNQNRPNPGKEQNPQS
ncbi:MAG: hypothetical protein K2M86_00730, partial [Odoribacter sp.]|nr:hypothetical protein [Odoribacter sp.]